MCTFGLDFFQSEINIPTYPDYFGKFEIHSMNILSIENITKNYSDKPLFSDLSFGLEEGEKRALIARNGSGKSTLMKIIAGIEKPDSGIISFRKDLRIGYLDQQPSFDPLQTVMQTALGISNPMTDAI